MRFFAFVILIAFSFSAGAAVSKKKPLRASAKKTSVKKRRPLKAPRRMVQQTPSPERYMAIQKALVTRGYLKSEPNGVWDTPSSDALRQFQSENGLSVTGKISAATLIKLGVGSPETSSSTAPATGAN